MSVYNLSGRGQQSLSNRVTAIYVLTTTPPVTHTVGNAEPPNEYHVALLRFGDGTGWSSTVAVEGGPHKIPVPDNTTLLGYACQFASAIQVTEIIGL